MRVGGARKWHEKVECVQRKSRGTGSILGMVQLLIYMLHVCFHGANDRVILH